MNKKKFTIIGILAIMGLVLVYYFNNNVILKKNEKNNIEKHFLTSEQLVQELDDFYKISIDNNKSSKYDNEKMDNIFAKKKDFVWSDKLDKLIVDFLMDNKISRNNKINYFWNKIEKGKIKEKDLEKVFYILDYLGSLYPIEKVDDLILLYKKQDDNYGLKNKIIEVLSETVDIANPEIQNKKELDFIIKKTDDVKKFLYGVVLNTFNYDIFKSSLESYLAVSSYEEGKEILFSIENEESVMKVNNEELIQYLVELAISASSDQDKMMSVIFNTYKNNEKNKKILNSIIIGELTDESSGEFFSDETKKIILKNINIEKSNFFVDEVESVEKIEEYYSWVVAIAKLKPGNKDILIKNMVFESDNPLEISSIILYSEDNLIKMIKKDLSFKKVFNILKESLENKFIDDDAKVIIRNAIKVLSEK